MAFCRIGAMASRQQALELSSDGATIAASRRRGFAGNAGCNRVGGEPDGLLVLWQVALGAHGVEMLDDALFGVDTFAETEFAAA